MSLNITQTLSFFQSLSDEDEVDGEIIMLGESKELDDLRASIKWCAFLRGQEFRRKKMRQRLNKEIEEASLSFWIDWNFEAGRPGFEQREEWSGEWGEGDSDEE
tara:strand:+ start:377 stop:688 length:312 start_codon:yes stop_codon:yes gene_type:complete